MSQGVPISEAEWQAFSSHLLPQTSKKRSTIFRQTETCKYVIYLTQGVTASIYNYDDKEIVTRFFQEGNFSTNIVSAVLKDVASDNLIAITDVEYILIPFELFIDLFLYSNTIGIFIRKKIIAHSLENKNFTTIKTIPDTRIKYQFMLDHYPQIMKRTPAKFIAKFLGMTPEGYSRFLASYRKS